MRTNKALLLMLICSMLVQVSLGSRARMRNAEPSKPKPHTTSTMTDREVEKLMEDMVYHAIASKKVVLFSHTLCRMCIDPKKVLAKYHIPPDQFQLWELDLEPKENHIWEHLEVIGGGQQVPTVFINGKFIDERMRVLHESGQLATLLNNN